MSRADWRSPEAYEDLLSLDTPGFAWEFLRRNADFIKDHSRLARAARRRTLTPKEVEAFARRWGVRFREGASDEEPLCPLGAKSIAKCGHRDGGSRRTYRP